MIYRVRVNISLKETFEMLELGSYYEAYKQELEELEDEHNTLTNTGHLLVIGIPKTLLSSCIYITGCDGIKAGTYINGIWTYDIHSVMYNLVTNPEKISDPNSIKFCLVLTGDILTPDSGIKVYSYNIANPTLLAAFEKKSADLFARIKKDIVRDLR